MYILFLSEELHLSLAGLVQFVVGTRFEEVFQILHWAQVGHT